MIYTKKTPWVLIIGIVMAGYAWLVQQGSMNGVMAALHTSKHAGEMVTMGYIFGALGIVIGLWQLAAKPAQGNFDYYASTVGGALLILLLVFVNKYGLEPQMKLWGSASQKAIGWNWASTLGVNYILLSSSAW